MSAGGSDVKVGSRIPITVNGSPPRSMLLPRKRSPSHHSRSEQPEKLRRNVHTLELFRTISAGQVYAGTPEIVRRHILKHLRLLSPNNELWNRRNVSVSLRRAQLELHQAIGFRIRKRLQQHRIDHREDRRVGANPQRQRRNRCGGKTRAATQHSAGVANVLPQNFKELPSFHRTVPPPISKTRKYSYRQWQESARVEHFENESNILAVNRK